MARATNTAASTMRKRLRRSGSGSSSGGSGWTSHLGSGWVCDGSSRELTGSSGSPRERRARGPRARDRHRHAFAVHDKRAGAWLCRDDVTSGNRTRGSTLDASRQQAETPQRSHGLARFEPSDIGDGEMGSSGDDHMDARSRPWSAAPRLLRQDHAPRSDLGLPDRDRQAQSVPAREPMCGHQNPDLRHQVYRIVPKRCGQWRSSHPSATARRRQNGGSSAWGPRTTLEGTDSATHSVTVMSAVFGSGGPYVTATSARSVAIGRALTGVVALRAHGGRNAHPDLAPKCTPRDLLQKDNERYRSDYGFFIYAELTVAASQAQESPSRRS